MEVGVWSAESLCHCDRLSMEMLSLQSLDDHTPVFLVL